MKKRMIACLVAAAMALGSLVLVAFAAEMPEKADLSNMTVIVDESFDDYDSDVDGKTSTLGQYFTMDANSIGDGSIKIQENGANLHLKSHVFTQIYTKDPLTKGYIYSMDIFQTQGAYQSGMFVRAPQTGAAYYEADGHEQNSACQSGIVLYFRNDALEVNIKTMDTSAPQNIGHNIFSFPLPDGVAYNDGQSYTGIRVEDNNHEIKFYAEDTLLCRLVPESPNARGYARLNITDSCFEKITVYDAAGAEQGVVENTLVMAKKANVGWFTRVADMIVDNVKLMVPASTVETEAPTAAPTEAPTQPVEAPTEEASAPVEDATHADTEPTTAPIGGETGEETTATAPTEPDVEVRYVDDSLLVPILLAVMLIAIGGAAGYITVKLKA